MPSAMTVVPLLLLVGLAAPQSNDSAADAAGLFQSLGPSSVYRGCGCTFSRAAEASGTEGPVLFSSNYEGAARIAVGGSLVTLSAARPDRDCWPSNIGDRCVLKYHGDKIRVVIKVQATWVCPTSDESESCEVVRLHGKMTGRGGDTDGVVEIVGECGC